MTSIAKQNTIEALTIYHKAQTNKWEVRVSESGNVRIASWTDRFKSGFRAIFNPSRERTNWNEKAKEAITEKLTKEITSLQKETDKDSIKNKVGLLLKNIKKVKKEEIFSSAKTIIFESKDLNLKPKDEEGFALNDAFDNKIIFDAETKEKLEQLWKIKDNKTYGLVIEELMNTPNSDLRKAINVANHTAYLIKQFGLSKKDATEASRKTCVAMEEFKFEFKEAYELARLAENLINKKHIEKDLPLKLQLSASLAFMQLRDKGTHPNEAIEIVKNRIDMLKEIQNRIPLDMQIDCVHKKEYEYKISFSKEEKEKIAEKLKTQLDSPLCKNNKMLENSEKKDLIAILDYQCLADAIRSKFFFYKDGNITNTPNVEIKSNQTKTAEKYASNGFLNEEYETFENSEIILDSNIEDTPESLLEKSFLIPLEKFQLKSNLNNKNISDISHFLSQTTMGTLTGFKFEESKFHIQGVSSKSRGESIYDVDFIEDETKEGNKRIVLRVAQYNDGDNLSILFNSVDKGPLNTLLPINEFFTYEQSEKAGPNKFRQKMNVDFEILINQNDEIKIKVIDAGLIYKFSINNEILDQKPWTEVFQ